MALKSYVIACNLACLRVYIKGRFSDFQSDDMSSNLVVRKSSKGEEGV